MQIWLYQSLTLHMGAVSLTCREGKSYILGPLRLRIGVSAIPYVSGGRAKVLGRTEIGDKRQVDANR